MTLSLLYVQSAWMEHYQATISTEDMDQEQTVGSFSWRYVATPTPNLFDVAYT